MELFLGTLTVLAAIGALAGLTSIFAVYYAWVLSWLWQWFAVDGLHLAPINLAVAYGLTLIVSFMIVLPLRTAEPTDKDQIANRIARWIINPAVTLGIGWIVHHWV